MRRKNVQVALSQEDDVEISEVTLRRHDTLPGGFELAAK